MADRVLEIGQFAAGFCGRLFVQAGHEVVRIEPRSPLPGWAGSLASDAFLHAGKRRLQTDDGGLVAELAARADVVVAEAETADDVQALGIDDWQTPVRATITPFGRTGPKRNWKATPHVLLAMGGYTYLMGDPARAPLSLPGHYVEFQAAQYAYAAASACRLAGESEAIDVGMLETVMSLSQFTTVQWHCKGEIRSRHGNDFWSVSPTNLYRLRDGWAYVNVVPRFWEPFTIFLGLPELLLDERFTTNDGRMAHREALNGIISRLMAGMTREDAERRAEELRIPVGVVQSLDEVLDDPHLRHRSFWQPVRLPDGTGVDSPGPVGRTDDAPPPPLELHEPERGNG